MNRCQETCASYSPLALDIGGASLLKQIGESDLHRPQTPAGDGVDKLALRHYLWLAKVTHHRRKRLRIGPETNQLLAKRPPRVFR